MSTVPAEFTGISLRVTPGHGPSWEQQEARLKVSGT
jgi:hypothetical protein